MMWKETVIRIINEKLKKELEIENISPVGGGSINEAFRLSTNVGSFFVKKNRTSLYPEMFEKEVKGIEILNYAKEIEVPEVVGIAKDDKDSFLILKYIESAERQHDFWVDFGDRLAQLHRHTQDCFGLDNNNYIGSLQQYNTFYQSWADFFREQRLEVQLKMARDRGLVRKEMVVAFERFYNKIGEIFPEEPPALLHGDLWSGNFMVGENGQPIVIDPAVYFGHREMDLGMSQLFGGFDAEFYDAYHKTYPLEKGWQQRLDYCNLYPLMVHVNLFGGGYVDSVKRIISRF